MAPQWLLVDVSGCRRSACVVPACWEVVGRSPVMRVYTTMSISGSPPGSPAAAQLDGPLLRPEEAAQLLAVKRSWIYEAVRAGRLPCLRVGRTHPLHAGDVGRLARRAARRVADSASTQALASRDICATWASSSAFWATADTGTSSARARLVIFSQVGLRTPRSIPDRYVGCISAANASVSIVSLRARRRRRIACPKSMFVGNMLRRRSSRERPDASRIPTPGPTRRPRRRRPRPRDAPAPHRSSPARCPRSRAPARS